MILLESLNDYDNNIIYYYYYYSNSYSNCQNFGLRFLIFIIVNFPVANYLSFGALYSCSL